MAVTSEARRLVRCATRWLNPLEGVECVNEPVPDYRGRE